ncbi:hypothetical protein AMECASPLE_010771 [Ameca splendens]|uniref:Uncharacterized protein n=1 Tax=Ameca splendens TaxID=208324 RepID=A0ABV1A9J5_9TELE
MTVQHRHKDQADGEEQITLWEYFRRAAERSACQEGQASEQQSPFWGTRLAVPLPGTGPLRCGSAPASSACHRQRRRRRTPIPDSVAGRGDTSAPCSTGGPHDAATPGSGSRSPPLSGFAAEERTAKPSTPAAAASAEPPTSATLPTEPSSPPPAAAEFHAGFSSRPGRRRRRGPVAAGKVRSGASYFSTEGLSDMVSSRLSSPEWGGWLPSALWRSPVSGATSNPSVGPGWTAVRQQGVHEGTLYGVRSPSDGLPSGPASCVHVCFGLPFS